MVTATLARRALPLGFASLLCFGSAHAQEMGSQEQQVGVALEASVTADAREDPTSMDPSAPPALLIGVKAGGTFPLNGLSPTLVGGLQLGGFFHAFDLEMAAFLDVTYAQPSTDGTEADARLAGGSYEWAVSQQELILQPTVAVRLPQLGPLIPRVGIGPRVYLLQTKSTGSANAEVILESTEQSTQIGAGLPLSLEVPMGPGAVMLEALVEWAPLDHRITGDTSLLGANATLGYRAALGL